MLSEPKLALTRSNLPHCRASAFSKIMIASSTPPGVIQFSNVAWRRVAFICSSLGPVRGIGGGGDRKRSSHIRRVVHHGILQGGGIIQFSVRKVAIGPKPSRVYMVSVYSATAYRIISDQARGDGQYHSAEEATLRPAQDRVPCERSIRYPIKLPSLTEDESVDKEVIEQLEERKKRVGSGSGIRDPSGVCPSLGGVVTFSMSCR